MQDIFKFVGFPKIARYSRKCVVTEKIDGTNGQIFIPQETELLLYPHFLVGAGKRWITPETDNHGFAKWAWENAEELMKLGPGRHFGEFWGQGINRGYGLKEKRFSLFNVKRWEDDAVRPVCCHVVPVLWRGNFEMLDVNLLSAFLSERGSQAAPGFMRPEGIVIWHSAGNVMFKKTIEKDAGGKGNE